MRSELKIAAAIIAVCSVVLAGTVLVLGPQEKQAGYGKIGIIGAMDEEVELLIDEMTCVHSDEIGGTTYHSGTLRGKEVVVVKSGMGKVNAAAAAATLINVYGVSAVMNTGVSGQLVDSLHPFSVVIPDKVIQHDFDYTAMGYERGEIPGLNKEFLPDGYLSGVLVETVMDNIPAGDSFAKGTCLSGDQFMDTEEQRNALLDLFPEGITCEMEGGQIAQVCTIYGVPFAELRVISDSDPGDFEKFMKKAAQMCATIMIGFVDEVWE